MATRIDEKPTLPIFSKNNEIEQGKKIKLYPNEDKKVEILEKKTINIELEDKDFLETADELKFKTFFLNNYPMKFRNFSKLQVPKEIQNLGHLDVDFGFEKLFSVNIKILKYEKFRMLEFKKRDFKFSIGIPEDTTIFLNTNGFYAYEINRDVKNNRLKVIFDFFINLFKGSTIKFHINNIICDLDFKLEMEEEKFEILSTMLDIYEKILDKENLKKDNFCLLESKVLYPLYLYDKLEDDSVLKSWVNLKIKNRQDLKEGDKLIIKRKHNIVLSNKEFNFDEELHLQVSLNKNELKGENLTMNRIPANIKIKT